MLIKLVKMAIDGHNPKPAVLKLLKETRKSRLIMAEPKSKSYLGQLSVPLTNKQRTFFYAGLKKLLKGLLAATNLIYDILMISAGFNTRAYSGNRLHNEAVIVKQLAMATGRVIRQLQCN